MNYKGKIGKNKGKSKITYMKETFTMQQFSTTVWKVSYFAIKTLHSNESSVTFDVQVFSNGKFLNNKNFVDIYIKNTSTQKHCYGVQMHFTALTVNGVVIDEQFLSNRWSGFTLEYGLNKFLSRQKFNNFITDHFEIDILKIMIQLFCWSFQELKVKNLINPSNMNLIEMMYDWTICDLKALNDASKGRLISGPFQSDFIQAKFNLQMLLRYDLGNVGDNELLSCIRSYVNTAFILPVYCTLIAKEKGFENNTLSHDPSLNV